VCEPVGHGSNSNACFIIYTEERRACVNAFLNVNCLGMDLFATFYLYYILNTQEMTGKTGGNKIVNVAFAQVDSNACFIIYTEERKVCLDVFSDAFTGVSRHPELCSLMFFS